MRHRFTITLLAGCAVAAAAGLHAAAQSGDSAPVTYAVDTVHSGVVFKIRHMDVANFYGMLPVVEGAYTLDEASPANSRFEFTVPVQDIETFNEQRNGHLLSPDFFNVREHPTITFTSTGVERVDDDTLKVTGDLTLLGTTKPVTATVDYWPGRETRQGFKSGLEATFNFKRSDYGMTKYIEGDALGDRIEVIVAVEAARQDG